MFQSTLLVRNIVYITLRSVGIFKTKIYSITYATGILSFISVLILGSVVGLLTCRGIADKLEVISIMLPEISSGLVFLNFLAANDEVLKLFSKLIQHEEHSDYIISQTDILVKRKLIRITIVMIVLAISSTTPSILYALFSDDISEKYSFVVPFWFSCGNGEIHVILKSLCWRVDTKPQLVISTTIQSAMGSAMFMIAFSAITLFSIVIYELSILVKIFKARIQQLAGAMRQRKTPMVFSLPAQNNAKMSHYERETYEEFVEIIKYQQYLKSCIIDTATTWSRYLSIHVINYSIILGVLLWVIVMERDQGVLLAIRVVCFNLYLFIGFALTCYYGHFISNLNEIVFDEICTLPWYEQNVKFRKIYTIALTLNRKAIRIKIVRMYELNLGLILALFRTSFSILNVLLLKHQIHE